MAHCPVDRYVPVDHVAKLLGKSDSTIRRWCANKTLLAVQPGGRKGAWLVALKDGWPIFE